MTLKYLEMDALDALYKTAREYPGGIDALAQRMGKSANVLRNKLRPSIGTHSITFEEASEVVELCKSVGVKDALQAIHALNWRHGLIAIEVPSVSHLSDDDLLNAAYRVMKEIGEVAESVADAKADDVITHPEYDVIEKRFSMAMSALAEWQQRVKMTAEKDSGPIRSNKSK